MKQNQIKTTIQQFHMRGSNAVLTDFEIESYFFETVLFFLYLDTFYTFVATLGLATCCWEAEIRGFWTINVKHCLHTIIW